MELKRKRNFLIRLLYFLAVVGIAIFICRKGLPVLLPFVIAFIVSLILSPAVGFLNRKCKMSRGAASVLLSVLFYILAGTLIFLSSGKLIRLAGELIANIPTFYRSAVEPFLRYLTEYLRTFVEKVDPTEAATVGSAISQAFSSFGSWVSSFSASALRKITGYAVSVPGYLVKTIITILATVYLCTDYAGIRSWILYQFPEDRQQFLRSARKELHETLGKYIRSYALIMLITLSELSIGFVIIGIANPLLTAALIAMLDILPVVGCGTVLIPWTVISFFQANYRLAIGLLIMYIIITVIRNIIEPRIIGDNIGVHPIVTLVSMVVGNNVFGPVGLLGLPITVALFKRLNDTGVIQIFRDPEDSDETPETAEEAGDGQLSAAEPNPAAKEAEPDGAPAAGTTAEEPEKKKEKQKRHLFRRNRNRGNAV